MGSAINNYIFDAVKEAILSKPKLDKGITEIHAFHSNQLDAEISIGASYESNLELDDGTVGNGYIFNLFVGSEYVNVPGAYTGMISGVKCYDVSQIIAGVFYKLVEDSQQRAQTPHNDVQ